MRDWKMQDQTFLTKIRDLKNTGPENVGPKNAGPN